MQYDYLESVIILNCREDEITRERLGFHSALERVGEVVVAPVRVVTPESVESVDGRCFRASDVQGLWHLDPPITPIPLGLPSATFPTVWVHMDAAVAVKWRSLWSRLVDVAGVCGWDGSGYTPKGFYRMVCQPCAARREWFDESGSNEEFDIGWVGVVHGHIFSRRARLMAQIVRRYRMNPNWEERISEHDVLPIYRRAKIVVNLHRDDIEPWFNVRFFEAVASGALAIIEQPTRLNLEGMRDGEHFIGYRSDADLFAKLDYYLAHPAERRRIAAAGKELVRQKHTYDDRVAELLDVIREETNGRKTQRRKPNSMETDFIYCHYFCKRVDLVNAKLCFNRLIKSAPLMAVRAFPVLMRCWQHELSRMRKSRVGFF